MKTYITGYLLAALISVIVTPIIAAFARTLGLVDVPDARKVHERPIPRIGGIAVALAFFGLVLPMALLPNLIGWSLRAEARPLAVLFVASAGIFLVGLADDIWTLKGKWKLLALLGAAIAVCAAGVRLENVQVLSWSIHLGKSGWVISILWIVGVTVAMNFIDGLDGLAGGICAITCGVIAIAADRHDQFMLTAVALVMLGSLSGFLIYNFNPARIFLGDCGSLFLGFIVGSLSLISAAQSGRGASLLLPALSLSVPLLDTGLTFLRRGVLQRRSLFAAERGHVHHRLMDLGFKHRTAVVVLHCVTLAVGGAGVLSIFTGRTTTVVILLGAVGLVLALFRMAGLLDVQGILSAVARNRSHDRETAGHREAFDQMQLRFRRVKHFGDWWKEMCAAAEHLGVVRITIPMTGRNGEDRTHSWTRAGCQFEAHEIMKMSVPIQQRRTGGPVMAQLEIPARSIERASHAVGYFGRLVEEFSLAALPDETRRKGRAVAGRPRRPAGRVNGAVRQANPRNGVGPIKPRVAIVHDFLYTYAGAERVLEQMLEVYPDAGLFSLFDFVPKEIRGFLKGKTPQTSFIQHLPFARKKHRAFLPLMPLAIEQLDVTAYDVVLSSSYLAAKGVITRPDQLHICYCHSPARFAWDLQHQYLEQAGLKKGAKAAIASVILHYIRNWDMRSAAGVDHFLTNSRFVAQRIQKFYRRQALPVYPPVDVSRFAIERTKEDYYLCVSRMVPYKRIDLVVEAFTEMPDKRLIVIGDGPEMDKIEQLAGPNVKLMGYQNDERVREYMRRARCFVFAAEEDFGIVPVEAQACGTPVVAFGRGGVTESVIEGVTGMFFYEQSVESVIECIHEFERHTWDPEVISRNAQRFSAPRFRIELETIIQEHWDAFHKSNGRAHLAGHNKAMDGLGLPAKLRSEVAEGMRSGSLPIMDTVRPAPPGAAAEHRGQSAEPGAGKTEPETPIEPTRG